MTFSARFHPALWMWLLKITYLLVFITFFRDFQFISQILQTFQHSGSENTSAKLSAHGQTNGALFSAFFLSPVITVLTHCGIIFASQFPSKPLHYLVGLVI